MNHQSIATDITDFKLRFATAEDCELIFDFIRQLAAYEKLSDQVTATPEMLRKHLFGNHPQAEVLFGEYKESPVAFALFFHNFSTFLGKPGLYLEDLFVKPEARGKGLGKKMLSYLAKLAVERGCGRLEWWVLDWNTDAIAFYQKLGAEAMDEWITYRLSGNTLELLAKEF